MRRLNKPYSFTSVFASAKVNHREGTDGTQLPGCTQAVPTAAGPAVTHEPMYEPPRRVRPPYDQPDPELTLNHIQDVVAYRRAVREDRMSALLAPLEGLVVTPVERRVLDWLTTWGTEPVAVVANLLWRAREAGDI